MEFQLCRWWAIPVEFLGVWWVQAKFRGCRQSGWWCRWFVGRHIGKQEVNIKRRKILSRKERNATRTQKKNTGIVIQRPDKGGGVVILNSEDYKAKLQHLLNDGLKFGEFSENKKLEVKKKINDIASQFKETNNDLFKVLHLTCYYANGHLYGLPKVHKNTNNPPLLPIICMSGTVTHARRSPAHQYHNSSVHEFSML